MSMSDQESNWKVFFRKHWGAVVIFGLAAFLVSAGSVYVFWWFVGNAQSSGLVPSSLGLWTLANLLSFILNLIFWEALLIGIPVVVGGVFGWMWWRRLPLAERLGYNFKRSRTSRGSGGGGLLFFIAFCIKVYLDGNANVPLATFTLNYVVSSMILILAIAAAIVGIPGVIFAVWWMNREIKKT